MATKRERERAQDARNRRVLARRIKRASRLPVPTAMDRIASALDLLVAFAEQSEAREARGEIRMEAALELQRTMEQGMRESREEGREATKTALEHQARVVDAVAPAPVGAVSHDALIAEVRKLHDLRVALLDAAKGVLEALEYKDDRRARIGLVAMIEALDDPKPEFVPTNVVQGVAFGKKRSKKRRSVQ